MNENTQVPQDTSFSTILLIAGAIVALGIAGGLAWWFWSQHSKIRDLEDEAKKLRNQIQNPEFTEAEQQALFGVAQGVISAQGSYADLGRAMSDTLSRMRKNDGKVPQTQSATSAVPVAPAQQPAQASTQGQQSAPVNNQAPALPAAEAAPVQAPAPANTQQPAQQTSAPQQNQPANGQQQKEKK